MDDRLRVWEEPGADDGEEGGEEGGRRSSEGRHCRDEMGVSEVSSHLLMCFEASPESQETQYSEASAGPRSMRLQVSPFREH